MPTAAATPSVVAPPIAPRDDLLLAVGEFIGHLPQNCIAAPRGVEARLRARIRDAMAKMKAE